MKKQILLCLSILLCAGLCTACVNTQKTIEYVYIEITPEPTEVAETPIPTQGKPAVPTLSPKPQMPRSYELPTPPPVEPGSNVTTYGMLNALSLETELYKQEIDNTIQKICEYADQKGTEEYRIAKECALKDQENWETIKDKLLENIDLKYKAIYAIEGGGTGLSLAQSGEVTEFYKQRLIEVTRMYAFLQRDLVFQAG